MDPRTGKYDDSTQTNQGLCIVYAIAIVIMLIPITILAVYGWKKHDTKIERCTEITSATLYDSGQYSRLMAPSFGGPVYEQVTYLDYYEYEIDGKRGMAVVHAHHPIPKVGMVDVYYNPKDTSEYYLDIDIFDDEWLMFDGPWDSRTGSETFWYKTD